jgi:DNA-binding SARP family transcriptional activator/tetratricopeptide (TPR) repeat protein
MDGGMEIRLLGKVTVLVNGHEVDMGPARQRCVMVALAVEAGRVVSMDRLAERVWGHEPPLRTRATLLSYLSRLRHALAAAGAPTVVRRPGGYALDVDPSQVDLHRFRDLCARAPAGTDDDQQQARLLEQALALWSGEALTGLGGEWVADVRDRMQDERRAAEHDLVDARLRAGQGEELVAQLSARTAQHPLDERAAGQYLLALHRAGRTADALAHYRQLRERLVEELGTDPGTALQDLHRQILAADPGLIPTPGRVAARPVVVPRQLPAAPASFVGRRDELDRLDAMLGDTSVTTMAIATIAGAGGIGKTWLALHWAYRHLDRFPDGQLFVNLRGFDPANQPLPPTVAVRGFLDALGIDPGHIPADPQTQTALFRSLLAGKRMLIVLDNAADTNHVTPLLPGGNTCTVVVTSRNTLTGLITRHDASHLPLTTLSDQDARALLAQHPGAARVAAEPEAVTELLTWCGGYPLALGIIAGRARVHPHLRLAELATELHDLGLTALEDNDPATGLRTVLSSSYHALPADQQTVFALLGIAPSTSISLTAAASLTGLSPARIARILRGLEEASLLAHDDRNRYAMHDLVRAYASELAAPEEARTARERLLDHYLRTVNVASSLLFPFRERIPLPPPHPGAVIPNLPDHDHAAEWLSTELPVLELLPAMAAENGFDRHAWQIPLAAERFLDRQGRWPEQVAMQHIGLTSAQRANDLFGMAQAHRALGLAYGRLHRFDEGTKYLRRALSLFIECDDPDDPDGQAHTHRLMAFLANMQADHDRALDHYLQAGALYQSSDNHTGQATLHNEVGWTYILRGDYEQALAQCLQAVDAHRMIGNPDGEAAALGSAGYALHHLDRNVEAITYLERALRLYRDTADRYLQADTLSHIGDAHAALGQDTEAKAAWHEALTILQTSATPTPTTSAPSS